LDDILSNQRSPAIKSGLGFHESVEGESSSQAKARNSNVKPEMLNKEIRGQLHQQPRKEIIQRNYFTLNHGNDSQLFPQIKKLNVLYVIILDMLQQDAKVEWFKTITQKHHQLAGTLRDIVFLAICLVTKPMTAIEEI